MARDCLLKICRKDNVEAKTDVCDELQPCLKTGTDDREVLLFIFQGCFNMQSRSSAAAAIQSATFPELDSVFLVDRKKKHLVRKELGWSRLRNSDRSGYLFPWLPSSGCLESALYSDQKSLLDPRRLYYMALFFRVPLRPLCHCPLHCRLEKLLHYYQIDHLANWPGTGSWVTPAKVVCFY